MAAKNSHVKFLGDFTDRAAAGNSKEKIVRGDNKGDVLAEDEKKAVKSLYLKSAGGEKEGSETLTQAFLSLKLKREQDKRKQSAIRANKVFRELLENVENVELRKSLEQECRDFSRRMSAMDQEVERKVEEIEESDQQHDTLTQVKL